MSGNICRCGAYGNIVAAIQRSQNNVTADGAVKKQTSPVAE